MHTYIYIHVNIYMYIICTAVEEVQKACLRPKIHTAPLPPQFAQLYYCCAAVKQRCRRRASGAPRP
jgi:hypothetical protein